MGPCKILEDGIDIVPFSYLLFLTAKRQRPFGPLEAALLVWMSTRTGGHYMSVRVFSASRN